MSVWNDLRLAARLLTKDRGFTITAVIVLALGISATSTVFTLGNGVFLRDLPFADPDRIVAIGTRTTGAETRFDNLSLAEIRDLQSSARLFDGIGAMDEVTISLADEGRAAERFVGSYITANSFALLGVQPILGRDFRPADDTAGAEPVVILSHALWQSRYEGDLNIVGRSVRANGVPSTVIGVMPEGFGFPTMSALWQPLAVRTGSTTADRRARAIDAFGRMRPEVTLQQAAADLDIVMNRLAREYPDTNQGIAARVRPFRDMNTGGPVRATFAALMAAVAFLLVIACANVANLLLGRAATRAREISVRLSLGATRARIVGQLLIESLLLAVMGGALGLVLALAGVRVVDRSIRGTGEPYWLQFPLDARVLTFFALVCLGTSVLFGLAPALHASRTSIAGVLNEAARGVAGARSRRLMSSIVVVQLTLTLVLMTGAGLTARNGIALSGIDAGIDMGGAITARFELPERSYPDAESRRLFYGRLDERLAALSGMRAGVGAWAPLGGAISRGVSIAGRPAQDRDARPRASNVIVGTGYFDAIGVTLVRGRAFTRMDGTPGAPTAIVNERFAALHFPGEDAIGREIELDSTGRDRPASGWLTIVGIVPNVRHEEYDTRIVEPVVYVPYPSDPVPFSTVIVRSPLEMSLLASTVRGAVREIDPDLPLYDVKRLESALASELTVSWIFGSMFAVFAIAALTLAGVGLYGVTAYSVAQRTREIGVRLALGARATHIWWAVSRRVAIQTCLGLSLGLAGSFAMGQVLQDALQAVTGRDPITLVAVAALLILVMAVACVGPVRRALRTDPMAALRAE
jgi:predicted permease